MPIYPVPAQDARTYPRHSKSQERLQQQGDALEAALADMKSTFQRDFADGRIGTKHNTYAHRSRILRQMTESLNRIRESDAGSLS